METTKHPLLRLWALAGTAHSQLVQAILSA